MKTLSILIPCYNEQATIADLVGKVASVVIPGWKIEMVIINDASLDGTAKIVDILKSKYSAHLVMKTIHRKQNGGKGTALVDGLNVATGDYFFIQDADLEYNPAEIPLLVSKLENSGEIIYGSRNLYHVKRRGFYIPRFGVWLTTKWVNLLFGANLTDVWTCYKLFPKSTKHFFVPGRFDSEIIFTVRVLKAGFKIVEVPISHKPRGVDEGKKIKYRDGIRALCIIAKERFYSK